jgi:hypothetical protein
VAARRTRRWTKRSHCNVPTFSIHLIKTTIQFLRGDRGRVTRAFLAIFLPYSQATFPLPRETGTVSTACQKNSRDL